MSCRDERETLLALHGHARTVVRHERVGRQVLPRVRVVLQIRIPESDRQELHAANDAAAALNAGNAAARLRSFVPAPAGAFAQDGGVVVDSLLDALPKEEWEKIEKEFFLL